MSLQSVKSLVARMHKDPEFKEKFAANPGEVLSGYELTTEERGAIIRLGIDDGPRVDPNTSWF